MSDEHTIRAWKDAEHRDTLSDEERRHITPNPAGEIELTDDELTKIQGGTDPLPPMTTITTITRDNPLVPDANQ